MIMAGAPRTSFRTPSNAEATAASSRCWHCKDFSFYGFVSTNPTKASEPVLALQWKGKPPAVQDGKAASCGRAPTVQRWQGRQLSEEGKATSCGKAASCPRKAKPPGVGKMAQ
eukprot:TRINITY_DN3654_c0_g1_i1.p5 TRINITY_DN3654_c0_g1~~TRINITY_DN3654_c0_g1_i1.p5  ORF type:complete len:113 (+),score=13.64 TRINITY_DN3654_c0_g1_i1:3089-3427(+)